MEDIEEVRHDVEFTIEELDFLHIVLASNILKFLEINLDIEELEKIDKKVVNMMEQQGRDLLIKKFKEIGYIYYGKK